MASILIMRLINVVSVSGYLGSCPINRTPIKNKPLAVHGVGLKLERMTLLTFNLHRRPKRWPNQAQQEATPSSRGEHPPDRSAAKATHSCLKKFQRQGLDDQRKRRKCSQKSE